MKRISVFLVVLTLAFIVNPVPLMAEDHASQGKVMDAVDAKNTVCPVSGDKIDDNTKATYEYEGKIYNFCCSACIEAFKKDPQKYINKLNDMEKTAKAETPSGMNMPSACMTGESKK